MASREGQGMQIAVILFAMLTVVLAITTYIFYAAAEKSNQDKVAADAAAASARDIEAKVSYQLIALKLTLGIDEIDQTKLEAAKARMGGAADPAVEKWLADFNSDMALVGEAVAAEGARNYRSLPGYLIAEIAKKSTSVITANDLAAGHKKDKDDGIASEQARAAVAEKASADTTANYAGERVAFNDEKARITKDKDELAAKVDSIDKASKAQIAKMQATIDTQSSQLSKASDLAKGLRTRVDELEDEQGANIDNPDGRVVWVNQKQRLVWLDLGYGDGLTRQATFSVFSQNQSSLFKTEEKPKLEGIGKEKVTTLQAKGRIEVVRIVGPHQAECRILEDHSSDPILPGDWIHSPAWSPGQQIHFALVGFMDINKDGQSDRDLIKNIIMLNGGVIDTEVLDDGTRDTGKMSVNTRYLVEGDKPGEKTNVLIKNPDQYAKVYNTLVSEQEQYGVTKISVQKLLDMMGWKPEEKTVGLGGSSDTSGFRVRQPGAKPAGAPKAPAATPMEEAPAEEGAAEPMPMPMEKPADPADPFGDK